MFFAFVVSCAGLVAAVIIESGGGNTFYQRSERIVRVLPMVFTVLAAMASCAVAWSVVYIPMRWNLLLRVARPTRILGLAGGFGLIGVTTAACLLCLSGLR